MTEQKKPKRSASGVFQAVGGLIGRQSAIEQLDAALARAAGKKKPQVVVVQGDVGVGKTRLVRGWLERLGGVGAQVRYFEAAATRDDPVHGVLGRLLRRRFSLSDQAEDSDAVRESVRKQCEEVFDDARMTEILHFLGSFIGLRFRDNPFLQLLEDDLLQHDTIASTVLKRFVEADGRQSPVVLVLDDLHLADELTIELLDDVGATIEETAVVLVVVGRPGTQLRRPGWALTDGNVTRIDLGPLTNDEAAEYVRTLLRPVAQLPDAFVEDAVEMSGGNPLLVNQLVRMLIDDRIIDIDQKPWKLDLKRFQEAEMPLSVEDAIQARLMSLSVEERAVLEKAAVVGNVFWFGALVVLSRLQIETREEKPLWQPGGEAASSAEVAERLRALVEALMEREYITRIPDSWIPGEEEYVFNHNLEHKAIVTTTHPDTAQRYHLFVAQWADARLKERTEEHLEFLAGHYARGGHSVRAAHYYVKAANLARARFANDQAIRCYGAALPILGPYDAITRIDVLHNLGDVCALMGRNHEALDHFSEMLRLSWLIDAVSKGAAALGRIGRVYRTLGEYDRAMERYQTAHRLFEQAGDKRGVAAALDDMGRVHWMRGQYAEALPLHEQALEIRRELKDDRSTAFTLSNMATVYRDTGRFKEALSWFEQSLKIRRAIHDRPGVVTSLDACGAVFRDLGDPDKAIEMWEEALKIAQEIGDRLQQAQVLARMTETYRRMEKPGKAREHVFQAVQIAANLGDLRLLSECDRVLGLLEIDGGDIEGGRERLDSALHLAEDGGYRAQIGAAQRALAKVAAERGQTAEAEERFEKAMAIFSEMGNHLEVARSCIAMAEFHERAGDAEKGKQLRKSAEDIMTRLKGAAGRSEG